MPDTTSRKDHLKWCKTRALEYVDAGDLAGALASMASDTGKHSETAGHPANELGLLLALGGHMTTPQQVRDHIEGYN